MNCPYCLTQLPADSNTGLLECKKCGTKFQTKDLYAAVAEYKKHLIPLTEGQANQLYADNPANN